MPRSDADIFRSVHRFVKLTGDRAGDKSVIDQRLFEHKGERCADGGNGN